MASEIPEYFMLLAHNSIRLCLLEFAWDGIFVVWSCSNLSDWVRQCRILKHRPGLCKWVTCTRQSSLSKTSAYSANKQQQKDTTENRLSIFMRNSQMNSISEWRVFKISYMQRSEEIKKLKAYNKCEQIFQFTARFRPWKTSLLHKFWTKKNARKTVAYSYRLELPWSFFRNLSYRLEVSEISS